MRTWLKFALIAFAALVLLGFLAAAVIAVWPRPVAQALASHLLGRPVAMSAFSIRWGNPLRVTIRDLTLGNIPDAQATSMLSIGRIEAEVDRRALLRGERVVYRQLRIEKPVLILERDMQGRGNWKFGPGGQGASPEGGVALMPKNRTQFPSLLDFRLTGGMVRYRLSSGDWLSIPLDDLVIQARDENAPVTLTLDGGYNDADAQLSATTASFNTLRDAEKPFDAGFAIVTPAARIDFKGVINEPLDFEAVQGRLALEAPQLEALLKIFRLAQGPNSGLDGISLRLAGGLTREGDLWQLDGVGGDLAGNRFEGSIGLHEAGRGKGDRIRTVLDFDRLDLAMLLPSRPDKRGDRPGWRAVTLRPPTAPDTTQVNLQVAAKTFVYAPWTAQDLTFAATLEPGRIDVERLAARLADGEVELRSTITASGNDSGELMLQAGLSHVNADKLLPMLGLPEAQIAGALDLRTAFTLRGPTLGQAMKTAQGQGVLAMQDGRIARSLIELASADLRTLFRQKNDAAALRCLLGVIDLRNGKGRIAPLTLRSPDGTVRGAGSFDLADPYIDLLIRSDPKTTGTFALDIPIRLHGRLDGEDLAAGPARGASLPELPAPALTGDMAKLAQGNPCWK